MANKRRVRRQPRGNYEVGYCRPPAAHQFKPGQSGNPKARKASTKTAITAETLSAEFQAVLNQRVAKRADGGAMTVMEASIHGLCQSALAGDMAAFGKLVKLMKKEGLLKLPEIKATGGVIWRKWQPPGEVDGEPPTQPPSP